MMNTRMTPTQRAFTLIETLVAISVLLVSLAGPLSIASSALRSALYARDQVTAFYLAQEAIEYVHAVRDENLLVGSSWLTGLDGCVDQTCTVDFPNFTHETCSGTCSPVLIGSSSGLFNHQGGTPSIFTRSFSIETVAGYPDEVVVAVTVSWQTGTLSRSFEIREHLLNWL